MEQVRLAIVVSEFNENITEQMLKQALEQAKAMDAIVRYICYSPGTFDMPILIDNLLKKDDVDAIVTIGAVIKGETKHDEVVAFNASRLIADLSLKHNKPITLGITGPDLTPEQAEDRIVPVARRAVVAAIKLVKRLNDIRNGKEGVIR